MSTEISFSTSDGTVTYFAQPLKAPVSQLPCTEFQVTAPSGYDCTGTAASSVTRFVSRQFVAASSHKLRALCARRWEDLNQVVRMIDGIHFWGQVLFVALAIAESGKSTFWE
jgi:hypothetical protein